MNRRQLTVRTAALWVALAAFGNAAQAQGDKPVRILVGFPPGGSIDIVARLLAEKMKDDLKTSVIVENRAGAGGRIAAELLKQSAGDGSTLMIAPVAVPVLAPLVFSKLSYDPAVDFSPVGHVCSFNFAVTVPAALPVKTAPELVAYLKAHPQSANFGSPAPGSLPHFFGEMLSRDAKADMVHVPFAGGAALLGALMGNQVSVGVDVVLETLEAHRSGKVRVIATSGDKRSSVLPDIPALKEQGYPNMVAQGWFAIYASAKTPPTAIDTYNRALNKALAQPDVLDRFAKLGLEPGGGSVADLTALERSSAARWAPVIKATGFRAD